MGSTLRASLVLAAAIVAALGTSACTEPPEREMNEAQGAIDAARAAGAAEYAADEFAAAVASLERSRTAVAERDYRQALNYALDARERAQAAARQAADGKARARTDADRLLRAAADALDRAQARLDAAVAARVPAPALAGPRQAIRGASNAIAAARAAFEKDDFSPARALGDEVARLDRVIGEIDAVVAQRASRRPPRRSRP
jgi:hypothetical protein